MRVPWPGQEKASLGVRRDRAEQGSEADQVLFRGGVAGGAVVVAGGTLCCDWARTVDGLERFAGVLT